MTKRLYLLLGLAAWAGLSLVAHAQMSNFPAPPPLPQSGNSASLNPSVAPVTPAPGSGSASTGKASGTSAPALTAATLNSMEALDDKTPLQDGDTVSFRVIEDRDDAVQRLVTDTGHVDFPYIGPVKVEGKTCHQVALEVKKLLEVDYYKQATVIIGLDLIVGQENTKPKEYAWVMGEVREVGPLELEKQQPMTVSQLVMRAGGPSDFADLRRVKLTHHGDSGDNAGANATDPKNYQIVDVKSIFDGKSTTDPVVVAGDYIIVPKKLLNGF
jgi:protein involved in polysaccharide export with SLBB domain